jgi:4-amino-4-deoxy-L-arabinose transferase-like glycosyltransferase
MNDESALMARRTSAPIVRSSTAPMVRSTIVALMVTLALLLVWRLALMALMPLADTTEARYGEITRLMIASGNWLMPYANPTEPFFAKPAFSFWIGAITGSMFGANEFGIRLAHFMAMMMAIVPLWLLLRDASKSTRLFAVVAAAMCPLVFISAGAVMTDAAQLACVSWGMLAAWRVLQNDVTSSRSDAHVNQWRYVFYLTLAIGALIKGVATMVLICMPLGLYAISGGYTQLGRVIKALWSIKGIILWLLVTVPWYALAERSYPGFLKYFILGEHVMRFIEPGWQGDRYGNAHLEARGMIWAFWAVSILPWLIPFLILAWQHFKPQQRFAAWRNATEETRYAWCFVLAPLLFFSFARNIIWTYVLTAVPAFIWLLSRWFEQRTARFQLTLAIAVATLTAASALPISSALIDTINNRSAKTLVQKARSAGYTGAQPLIVYGVYPFSSQFYSQAKADSFEDGNKIAAKLAVPGSYVIMETDVLNKIKDSLRFETLATNDRATLIRIR